MRHATFAAIFVALAPMLSSCIQTQELALAPNVVRLDTRASGLLFVNQASTQTQRRAAELTIQNGYSHFKFDQAQMAQGSELGGVVTSAQSYGVGNATAQRFGNTTYVNGSGYSTGSAISTPVYRPTSSVGVTVYMFHANEPGAQGAFDAGEVLKRLN